MTPSLPSASSSSFKYWPAAVSRYFANPVEAQEFRLFTWKHLGLSPTSLRGSSNRNRKIRVFLAERSSKRKILNEDEVKATLLKTGLVRLDIFSC
jgi:hypothetical protein